MFDIQGARKEGYSDSEISDYLATQSKFDIAGARKEGYSDSEIITHLEKSSLVKQPPVPKSLWEKTKGAVGEGVNLAINALPQPFGLVADVAPSMTVPFATGGVKGLAGLGTLAVTGDPQYATNVMEDVGKQLEPIDQAVQPVTPMGKAVVGGLSKPFELAHEMAEGAREYWESKGQYKTGFVNSMLLESAPFLLPFAPKLLKLARERGTSPVKIVEEIKQSTTEPEGGIKQSATEPTVETSELPIITVKGIRAKTGKVFEHKVSIKEAMGMLDDPVYASQKQAILSQLPKSSLTEPPSVLPKEWVERRKLQEADMKANPEKYGGIERRQENIKLNDQFAAQMEKDAGGYTVPENMKGFTIEELKNMPDETVQKPTVEGQPKIPEPSILPEGMKPVQTIQSFLKSGEKEITLSEVKQLRNVKSKELTPQRAVEMLRENGINLVKKKTVIEELKKMPDETTQKPIPKPSILPDESGFLRIGKENLFKSDEKTNMQKAVRGVDKFLGIISTRVGNISPALKTRLKRHAFDQSINTTRDNKSIESFYKEVDKLSSEDKVTITQLLHNQDFVAAARLLQKNKIDPSGFTNALKVVGNIADRGIATGMKIEKNIKNYWPSRVKNYEGLMKHLEETGRGEVATQIEKAISEATKEFPDLTMEERGVIADKMLRGFPQSKISLSDPKYAKKRTMDNLTFEDARFYEPAHEALTTYIYDMNKKIADNKLFGKGNQPSKADMKLRKIYDFDYSELGIGDKQGVDASIGNILEMERNKGKRFTTEEELDLRSMIKSYLYPQSVNPIVKAAKTGTYTALLTDVSTAVTQLQSEGLTLGMFANTPKKFVKYYLPAWKDVITRKGLKMADIGIDSAKADFERKGLSPFVAKVIGSAFRIADIANKEALANTIYRTYKDLAKNKDPKFMKDLETMFGKESERVRNEIISDKKTDDAMFAVNSTVAEFHPISALEVPQKYLDSSSWNMLMTLHTYQLKQLHVFREKVYNEIKSGNVKEGMGNMMKLTTALIAVGMPINYLQDFIKGKDPEDWKTYFLDSALQIIGMNKYMYERVEKGRKTEKVSAVLKSVSPAIINIAYNVLRDTITAFEASKSSGFIKDAPKNYKTIQYVPLVGREIYNRTDAYKDLVEKHLKQKYQGLIKEP